MSDSSSNGAASAADREARLEELLAELMRADDAGLAVDAKQWIADHGEFATELTEYFARKDQVRQIVRPLRHAAANSLHVRCPHCHCPIELAEDAPLSEISCSSCGESFSLVGLEGSHPLAVAGKTIDHFELLHCVGAGQFGSVWKARDLKLDRPVAVKFPRRGQLNETETALFLRDARATAQLQHPNIVGVHEVGTQDEALYIVSDFIEGVTLKEWLAEAPPTPREAAALCAQIAKALHHAHEAGVIHRDLKPGNIMMDAQGEPHLVDFGLAKREAGEVTMTLDGQILGTPAYMSPEQARGEGHAVDRRADVYSLGVILFELLTGELPFRGDKPMLIVQILNDEPPSPRKLNLAVPKDLETICLKCLEKDADKRYDSGLELAHELERFQFGDPIRARPLGRIRRGWRWCRRNPYVAGLAAATLLLLLTNAAVSRLKYLSEAELRQESEQALHDLENEQRRAVRLEGDVGQLESRLGELAAAVEEEKQKLSTGEGELAQVYLQLAETALRDDNLELAFYYLEQCPEDQRNELWRDLRKQARPNALTIDGRMCVAMSKDGMLVAGAAADDPHVVRVWDAASGQLLHELSGHDRYVNAVSFSPDGSKLASGGGRQVIVWDLARNEAARVLEGHSVEVTDVQFGPDGTKLASASSDGSKVRGETIIWSLSDGRALHTLPSVKYAVLNHDGRRLASLRYTSTERMSYRAEIVVWDLASNEGAESAFTIDLIDDGCRPAFHPTKDELAVVRQRAYVVWDVETWDVISQRFVDHVPGGVESRITSLCYSPSGARLAFASASLDEDFTSLRATRNFGIAIWSAISKRRVRTLPWYSNEVVALEFGLHDRQLAAVTKGMGAQIKLWDAPSLNPTEAILADIAKMDVGRLDWPQWGGSSSRTNTPLGNNIPAYWRVGEFDYVTGAWDSEGAANIKWVAQLGSQTYGNPVVANGKIYVGTNNSAGYLSRYPPEVDLGVLLCFDEQTGRFLWQHSNEKLPTGRVHDWPLQGVCSTPVADGDRLWYVSNRGEIVCLDAEGFYDGEDDGPESGVWNPFLDLPTHVRTVLDGRYGTYSWRNVLRGHGVVLPSNCYVRKVDDGWIVYESVRDTRASNNWSRVDRYRVSRDGDEIRFFELLDGDDAEKEVVAINDLRFPHLGTDAVVDDLREHFADAGVNLPEQLDVHTDEPGKTWSFMVAVDGRPTEFRLRLGSFGLLVERRVEVDVHQEADVVWRFNMMTELGVSQHNMANCSMAMADGVLFVCTSNGCDVAHNYIPAPEAPSFIAVDRETGQVLWTDNSPGENILHAQWASPSNGVFDGQPQVIFPGGDGWVYSFDPAGDGQGGSKLLWKFDGNPKLSKWDLMDRGTRCNIISFPTIYDGLVYVGMGQDPEHGEGPGHLWCIDPTKRGDVSAELAVDSEGNILPPRRIQAVNVAQGEQAIANPNSAVVWHYDRQDLDGDGEFSFEETFHRSISIPAIKDDILYTADFSGLFHCLNAKTGNVYWTYDLLAACWGSPLLVDDKVYMGDEDGEVVVFRHTPRPKLAVKTVRRPGGELELSSQPGRSQPVLVNVLSMSNSVYMTPIVANNVLYIANRKHLFAIEESRDLPRPTSIAP